MPLITVEREDGSELRFMVQEPGDKYIAELEGQAEEQASAIRGQDERIIQQQTEIERLRDALEQIENLGAESDGKTDLTVRMFYVAHRALGGEG